MMKRSWPRIAYDPHNAAFKNAIIDNKTGMYLVDLVMITVLCTRLWQVRKA